uniref:E3 ubiquitin-protein ligase TRIM39-like n=1 Tax=Salmo trutta TaxID=8032 RepID=A0A674F2F4_SALTR
MNAGCGKQFLCSICLDVFTEPVSIPCGHNFCKACISGYWDTSDLCQCPMCKEKFYRRPELRINTFISEMAAQFRKAVQLINPVENLEDRMCKKHERLLELFCRTDQTCVCQFCTESDHKTHDAVPLEEECGERKRLQKVQEIQHSVDLSKRERQRERYQTVYRSSLIWFAPLREASRKQQRGRLKGSLKSWSRKSLSYRGEALNWSSSHTLRTTSTSYRAVHPSAPLHPPRTGLRSVFTVICVGTVRRAVSQLEETLNKEMEKLPEVKLKRIQQYAVDVTLDPDTAHPSLVLSEDGKQVRHGNTKQHLPDKPVRFSTCPCILGKEGFSSGRFYYEVTVKGKTNWDLGVARESITRKGDITLSPEDGYWTVWLRNGEQYKALSSPSVLLSLREKPQKVGVFVDYEEGQVSFYDVEARSHIYSFTGCTFTEKVYPYFYPGNNDGGENSTPLTISPVNQTE